MIRTRVRNWREQGYPGVTRTTLELLQYWQREGRKHRLFFAQIEAAETIIAKNSLCLRPSDRKSTRLNSSHLGISYAVFCLKKKNTKYKIYKKLSLSKNNNL